jgi:hypothetical protein
MAPFVFGPWGWAARLIFPLQFDALLGILTLALFQVLARFPEVRAKSSSSLIACFAGQCASSNTSDLCYFCLVDR